MHADKLNSFEQEMLNRFLLHHMSMETRGKLMVEFPVIYRKLLGRSADAKMADSVKKAVLGTSENYYDPDRLAALIDARNMTPRDWMFLADMREQGVPLERAIASLEDE